MLEDRIMKRIAFFISSIIALCSLYSCQEIELNVDPNCDQVTVIKATLPAGNKAALFEKQLVWTAEDIIVVSFTDASTADFTLTEGAGTTEGTFEGTIPAGKTVSGATAQSAALFSAGKQIYSATEFPYSLVYTGSDIGNIVFDFDASSYIALTLKGDSSVLVESIEVNAGSDYVLDCGDGVALSSEGVPFYIMLTNEEIDAKLKGIVVTTTAGKTMTISVDKSFADMIDDGSATSTKGHVFPSTKAYKEDLFSGGAGTAAYPFKLANAADIKNFAAYSNGTGVPTPWASFNFASASYNVTGNITMAAGDVIAPAFTSSSTPFVGTFDGGSKTVTGLVINNTANVPCGLFSYAGSGSVIKNLKLMNVKVTSSYVETAAFVGHAEGATLTALNIDGNSKSTITSTACVTPTPANKYGNIAQAYMSVVGGVAGYAYDTDISNCTVSGYPSSKYRVVGGIVAYAGGSTNVTNCTIGKYSCVISGNTVCGGIVGVSQSSGTIKGCKVYGTMESTQHYCGGVVGAAYSGNILNCNVDGAKLKISTDKYNNIGGICGIISGGSPVVEGCVIKNTSITAETSSNAGFVVGRIDGGTKVTVSKCVVGSNCVMTVANWAGGILGSAANPSGLGIVIDQCSSYGKITTAASANGVGGIAGTLTGAAGVTNAYVVVSNCLFEKGTLTATSSAPAMGGIAGKVGLSATNTPQVYIVNCYTKGATLTDSNAVKYMAGIVGRPDYGVHIFGCWSDVEAGTTLVGAPGNTLFPIFYWMLDFASSGNAASYVYYPSTFTAPGSCQTGADMNNVTPKEGIADFTDSSFLDKMNAAATAYNASPLIAGTTAAAWVAAEGGPTLKTAIADPDM